VHARGANAHLDAHLHRWERWFDEGAISESTVRAFVEVTALALQAAALRDGPKEVLDGPFGFGRSVFRLCRFHGQYRGRKAD
jgi:hypothetical protein